jgi:Tfp pilus assembly protein PilN
MIKINLLNSVTDRQNGTVAAVDRKVSSPKARFAMMAVVVTVMTAAIIGWDVISTNMAKTDAEQQLDEQKRISSELEAVQAEMNDLDVRIKNIDGRISAIKKLRDSQAGPSAVLEALKERIMMTPGLYLESVEQTGDQMTIKGNSPDESQVTQFGRSLEFSNGLFSNLSIETQRADVQNQEAPQKASTSTDPEAGKVHLVNFTIKCAYTPSKSAQGVNGANPAQASAQTPAGPQQPAQQGGQQSVARK